jgi:hypothetical protein
MLQNIHIYIYISLLNIIKSSPIETEVRLDDNNPQRQMLFSNCQSSTSDVWTATTFTILFTTESFLMGSSSQHRNIICVNNAR